MKKLALLTLSSFLVLGACSHSNDTVKDVNESAHKKNNPKAHKSKGNSERVDSKRINKN